MENNFSVKTSFMANLIGIKENVPITFEKYKSTIIFPPFMHNREKWVRKRENQKRETWKVASASYFAVNRSTSLTMTQGPSQSAICSSAHHASFCFPSSVSLALCRSYFGNNLEGRSGTLAWLTEVASVSVSCVSSSWGRLLRALGQPILSILVILWSLLLASGRWVYHSAMPSHLPGHVPSCHVFVTECLWVLCQRLWRHWNC